MEPEILVETALNLSYLNAPCIPAAAHVAESSAACAVKAIIGVAVAFTFFSSKSADHWRDRGENSGTFSLKIR